MRIKFTLFTLMVLMVVFSIKVQAESKSSNRVEKGGYVIEKRGDTKIKYKKKNVYDFEGQSIDGLFSRPSGSYISNIKDVKGRSVIRVRKNFDSEIIDSARLLK